MTELEEKKEVLVRLLRNLPSCVIAFSGGLDSVFLAVMASRHVTGRVLCVTIEDAATPKNDLQNARDIAKKYCLEHLVVSRALSNRVRSNTKDRCYHCKLEMFKQLEAIKIEEGLSAILDGENVSDSKDDRPGSRAARECGVISPLAEAGLRKEEIRALAREMGIETWGRPPSACLSSRIPYGTMIEDEVLRKVDETEEFIRSKGIHMIRARVEGRGVRLELGQEENTPENRAMLEKIAPAIMNLGWDSVMVDPSGYAPAGMRQKNEWKRSSK